MKKSQLRQIIRESIKELMTESSFMLPSKSDLEKAARIINKQKTQVNPEPDETNVSEPIKEQAVCDNTPQGACAQQWMPPNLANNFLPSNHACTGSNTFKGLHDNNNAWGNGNINMTLWHQTWMQLHSFTTGPMSYGEISTFVNTYAASAGISTSLRGQIKRKWAKGGWARCMGATWSYSSGISWSGGNCNC